MQHIRQNAYQRQNCNRHCHRTTISKKLKHFIITGWPDSKDEISAELKPYWSYRDKLVVTDGMILKGRCIIIPNTLQQRVLDQLHTNHMGIEKMKLLACKCVYWHSINADIEKYIKQCWRIVVISGTVHWLLLKTSFHPLLWTSSGLTGSWKTKHLY